MLVVRGPGESSREDPASARPRGLPSGENWGSQLRPLWRPKEAQSANYPTLSSSFRKRGRARLFVTPPTVSPPAASAVCGQGWGVPCVLRWWPCLCRSGSQTASISRVCALRQVQVKRLWCAVSPCNRWDSAFFFFFNKKGLFIYSERDRERGEGEGQRESQAGSALSAQSPTRGWNSRTVRS